MNGFLDKYEEIAGRDVIEQLRQLSDSLRGLRVVHVNSTRVGGGVAEILDMLVPLMRELGLDASWLVMEGNEEFFHVTKSFHNALQGNTVHIPEKLLDLYRAVNEENVAVFRDELEQADIVFIHDPQPAGFLDLCPERRGKWIWRCHIDLSRPYRPVWKFLSNFVTRYDASVFSLAAFAQVMPHPVYIIPPSIDPLSEKNIELPTSEIRAVQDAFGIDPDRPTVVQVSRFDRFKDPLGVIQAHSLARRFVPGLQLVLAGGTAVDDPESAQVLAEVHAAAAGDPDIIVLSLPPEADRTVNALQRIADIVMQKSLKEGFGLTVTEGMWKGKPVVAGNTGGIRLQVVNHHTGFLVNTPEGAALRLRHLLFNRPRLEQMGRDAREFVRENYLITRHLREYLTLMVALIHGNHDRIELL